MEATASAITLISLAYRSAHAAWTTFSNGINFSSDSEDLMIQLELERFRLQTWASNAGFIEGSTSWVEHVPMCDIITYQLNLIAETIRDSDALRKRYGLSMEQDGGGSEENRVTRARAKIQMLLQRAGLQVVGASDALNAASVEDQETGVNATTTTTTGSRQRIRWAVRDKSMLEQLIVRLRSNINTLNRLLTETQRRSVTEDWKRTNIVVVGAVQDEETLNMIREAVRGEDDGAPLLRRLVERRAIADNWQTGARQPAAGSSGRLELRDLQLPREYQLEVRFLAKHKNDGYCALVEKKEYGDISRTDKKILEGRMRRLVLLLRGPRSAGLRSLPAVDFIDDSPNACWWLVFRFEPANNQAVAHVQNLSKSQPISLDTLLRSEFLPPLEKRIWLANKLAASFSELFSSSWLHKGIQSGNILFPDIYNVSTGERPTLENFGYLSSPFIAGFNYTRQDSEGQTIDKNKTHSDITRIIHRHPNYQGDAAQGYRIHYDIYSFGLLLVEIARWRPLSSFLDARLSSSASSHATPTVVLSSRMHHFHKPEADELRRRVAGFVTREMAFRVGSTYCNAVEWCLNYADQQDDSQGAEWQPALQFYNKVAAPLQRLATIEIT
jgi:hypothetical protein